MVEFYGPLRSALGMDVIQLSLGGRRKLSEVLKILDGMVGGRILDEKGNPRAGILILVNGADIRYMSWLETEVSDEDILAFVPAIHGGSYACSKD